jgi:hypothetical protein
MERRFTNRRFVGRRFGNRRSLFWKASFSRPGVSVVSPTVSLLQLAEIDAAIDDGDLSSGRFQVSASGRYSCILE